MRLPGMGAPGPRKRGELLCLLRPCFARPEPWLQAWEYVSALVASCGSVTGGRSLSMRVTGRRTGRSGCSTGPRGTPRGDGHVRRFAVAGVDEAAGSPRRRRGLVIGAQDETGQEKQGCHGRRPAPVPGLRGRVATGINVTSLTCVSVRACADRLPAVDTPRPDRGSGEMLAMGCPTWSSARRGSWPSTSAQMPSGTAYCSISSAAMRSTETARNCGRSSRGRGQAYVLRDLNFRLTLPGGRKLTCADAAAMLLARKHPEVRSAGKAPRASAGMRGRGWLPSPRGTAC